jgi:CubicO group peptidase (beta-lactamase class C family)
MVSEAQVPPNPARELIGIWKAKREFGPEVRGTLTLAKRKGEWEARIAGYILRTEAQDGAIKFEIPGGGGELRARIDPRTGEIRGHWIQPPGVNTGRRMASPVRLQPYGENRWRGEVLPLEDEFTLYLVVSAREDGSVGAFLRNPERNIGVFLNVERVERTGQAVRLIGRFLRNQEERVLAEGTYHREEGRLSFYFPSRGGTYDFERTDEDPGSLFYARGKNPSDYRYVPPSLEDDGWAVGTLEEAGVSGEPIEKLIETVIYPPAKSLHDPYIHGFLLARHGKLILEEYFHGFHREKPHDTRSASKSLTATLVGAAIQNGAPFDASSSVYEVIYGNRLSADTDPRKREMTVEHLLTMSSGFDCDDRDPSSPGNEDVMQEQTQEPDWYRYTLSLSMVRSPGEKSVYCSINANLLGAVLSSATGKSLPELFVALIAEPLQIRRYHLLLTPTDDAYMGGGIYWLPRDFMKLGQVVLNGGTWNGRRIVSREWASRATAPLVDLRGRKYGYLWWTLEYPYKGRTIRAFFAGGNGGQIVMGIPELDLLVAFYAGNYSDPVLYKIQEEFVPQYILPAIDNSGPD